MPVSFTTADCAQLTERGIAPERARRQLAQLAAGQAWVRLERPCRLGDGIAQLDPTRQPELDTRFAAAVEGGRMSRFVPASGAASRMFQPLAVEPQVLEAVRTSRESSREEKAAQGLERFLAELPRFAFFSDLKDALAKDDLNLDELVAARDLATLIRYLLQPCGLGYADLPKGLLAFHQGSDGRPRSPFIEHQAEAALLTAGQAPTRLHMTVSAEHLALFETQAEHWRETLEQGYGCRIALSYSVQKPATDTLALDSEGGVLRDNEGQLVLRPGGHGALLENLAELDGDIVLVRNIDNVVPDCRKQPNLTWSRGLTGLLLQLQEEQHGLLRELQQHGDDPLVRDLALAFLYDRMQLSVPVDLDPAGLIEQLDRPLRVCGMVASCGEPGGGPFWVKDRQGCERRQIVEAAQIDHADPEQAAILAAATHFNPVDMVCALRDWQGRPYDLRRFVDAEAVIVTSKFQQGQEIRVLELPGLWNGAMAGWLTLFVEIPPSAFNPVKTLFDLLRPAHQP